MKHIILRYLSFALVVSTLFTACRKDAFYNEDNEETNGGSSIIKVMGGKEPTVFLDALTGIKKVTIFSLRKDAGSANALQQPTTVTLTYDPSVLAAYNAAHPTQTAAEILPDALFTIANGITRTATGFEVKMPAGEFARDFDINLNFDTFDFNKRYVFPFKITSDLSAPSIVQPTLVITVSVKNKWDGKYSVSGGFIQRYTAPTVQEVGTLSGTMAGNPDITLATVNATSLTLSGMQWTGAGTGGGVGGVDPITVTVDPVTNKVTQIKSGVATTMAIIPGAVNEYNPATKTFTFNFNWNQTANKREVTNLVIKYKEPR